VGDDAALAAAGPGRPPEPWVPRHWLFGEVGRWRGTGGRALILQGPPGAGKTAAARQLVSPEGALFPVHASFFCGDTPVPPTAQAVLEALKDQLIHTLPGYSEQMQELYRRDMQQGVQIEVESVEAGAAFIAIGALNLAHRRSTEALLEDLFQTPFRTLEAGGQLPDDVFAVIDGIDGTASALDQPRLEDPLLRALADIPRLRLVATRRPQEDPHAGSPAHVEVFDLDDARSADDVEKYLSVRLSGDDLMMTQYLPHLIRLSGRNLLVARYLADNVDLLPLAALETMTGELIARDEVYDELLRRQVQQSGGSSPEWQERFRKVLAIIAQGRDVSGMPVLLVERAAEKLLGEPEGSTTVRDIMRACRSFIQVEPDDDGVAAVRPYHPSFRDYLLSPRGGGSALGRPSDDAAVVHKVIAALLAEQWEREATGAQPPAGDAERELTPYRLGHFLAHLASADGYGPDGSPIRVADRPQLIFQIAERHGVPYLLRQLGQVAGQARRSQPEMWLLNVVAGIQLPNLIDLPAQELEDRFFQQLLAQARMIGAVDLATELLAELRLRQLSAFVTTWATGRSDRLPVLHQLGHGSTMITALAPLGDDTVAVAAADGAVRIWDIVAGTRLRTLGDGHGYAVRALVVTDRQSLLVAGCDDGMGYCWNPRTGAPLLPHSFGAPVSLLTAVPGSDQVLAGLPTTVSLWDPADGRSTTLNCPADADAVIAVLAALGSPLVVVRSGGWIGLFDRATGDPAGTAADAGPVCCAALSDCGRYLATGHPDGTVTVWDMHDPPLRPRKQQAASRARISAMAAGPAARGTGLIITGDREGSVTAWNAARGLPVWSRQGTQRGLTPTGGGAHSGEVTAAAVVGSARYALTGGRDGLSNVWDLPTGERRHHLLCGSPVTAVATNRDGQYALTGTNRGEVLVSRVWAGEGPACLPSQDAPVSAAVAVGGAFVTVAGRGVRAWDSSDGRVLQDWAHAAEVRSMASLGGEVITGSADGAVRLWSPRSREPVRVLVAGGPAVTAVAAGGDDTIVAGSADGVIRAWRDGLLQPRATNAGAPVENLLVDRTGKNAVSTHSDRSARIWDLSSGAVIAEFQDLLMTVVAVAASADGSWLAMGCQDGTVLVAGFQDGRVVARIGQQWPRLLSCLAFTGTGERLVVGYDDGSARLWDMPAAAWTPERLLHPGAVASVVPLGAQDFVTGSEDGSVGLWRLRDRGPTVELRAHLIAAGPIRCLAAEPSSGSVLAGTASGDVLCATVGS
jgi:WD40 repeat protein